MSVCMCVWLNILFELSENKLLDLDLPSDLTTYLRKLVESEFLSRVIMPSYEKC